MKKAKGKCNTMSKLSYPNTGIYNSSRGYLESAERNMSNAISNCNFDIPSNFRYRSYLNSLRTELNNYYKELISIDSKLKRTNNSFETLDSDLTASTKKMATTKIIERDRMIY